MNEGYENKEPFCLHMSLLTDERKNVKRLIEAAKKYQFKLVLGGKLHNEKQLQLLNSWIDNTPNIEYKGFLSNEQLIDLYKRARVFALPSTNEGVGIVGLEAASLGCDIVLTSLGGPKEYYNNLAEIVNPFDVDEIGKAVVKYLQGHTNQPMLGEYVRKQYSLKNISKQLETSYLSIV
jgi:glycosyltransferase involved in cell wall biosynthesis